MMDVFNHPLAIPGCPKCGGTGTVGIPTPKRMPDGQVVTLHLQERCVCLDREPLTPFALGVRAKAIPLLANPDCPDCGGLGEIWNDYPVTQEMRTDEERAPVRVLVEVERRRRECHCPATDERRRPAIVGGDKPT